MPFKFSPITLILGGTIVAMTSAQAKETPPPVTESEAPQVRALLDHGWAAEAGIGQFRNGLLAAALYCRAGELGSAEGYYRAGLMYYTGKLIPRSVAVAAGYFSVASQLGHHDGAARLEMTGPSTGLPPPCISIEQATVAGSRFDLDQYVDELPRHKQRVAALIRKLAPRYLVDVRLALAIASVESNFEVRARSPKNAQGVMQLIPETAARFSVKNPFNAEQNIHGGLAYLRWLLNYFEGDVTRAVAAYNAGEKSVDRYGGIPPYNETRDYVRLVLYYAGH